MNCPVATIKKAIRKVQIPSQLPPRPKGHRFLGILSGKQSWKLYFEEALKRYRLLQVRRETRLPGCPSRSDCRRVGGQRPGLHQVEHAAEAAGRQAGDQRRGALAAPAQPSAAAPQPRAAARLWPHHHSPHRSHDELLAGRGSPRYRSRHDGTDAECGR